MTSTLTAHTTWAGRDGTTASQARAPEPGHGVPGIVTSPSRPVPPLTHRLKESNHGPQ